MKEKLQKYPWFLILLPVFFVTHGFAENFGFIDPADVLLLAGIYTAVSIGIFGILYLVYRNSANASLFTAYLMTFYLFFGAIHDFLREHLVPLSKYSILLSIFLLLLIVLAIYFKRTKRTFYTLSLFINILLIIYVTVDIISIVYKTTQTASASPVFKEKINPIPPNVEKPDIYFLLFDEYASSLSLKENYGFNNNIDSFLTEKGFHIQEKSHSNYNFTVVSIASILNMSYIPLIRENTVLTAIDMNHCSNLVKDNKVTQFLSANGYDIVNLSPFDLGDHPSPTRQRLLPLKTLLITSKTLFSTLYRDMGWMLITDKFKLNAFLPRFFYEVENNNDKIIKLTKEQSLQQSSRPRFVYSHLFMPHSPIYFDKNGRSIPFLKAIEKPVRTEAYLEYLLYTNNKIKDLITTIQSNTKGEAVIILMGDHGFRRYITKDVPQNFQNMNAVYFPDRKYQLLYDSISCVNQFRVVFNSLYGSSIGLLKDTTTFSTGKE